MEQQTTKAYPQVTVRWRQYCGVYARAIPQPTLAAYEPGGRIEWINGEMRVTYYVPVWTREAAR